MALGSRPNAPSAGLEPATFGVETRCSFQLSYEGLSGGGGTRTRVLRSIDESSPSAVAGGCRAMKGSDTLFVALAVCVRPCCPVGTGGKRASLVMAPGPQGWGCRAELTSWDQAASTRSSR